MLAGFSWRTRNSWPHPVKSHVELQSWVVNRVLKTYPHAHIISAEWSLSGSQCSVFHSFTYLIKIIPSHICFAPSPDSFPYSCPIDVSRKRKKSLNPDCQPLFSRLLLFVAQKTVWVTNTCDFLACSSWHDFSRKLFQYKVSHPKVTGQHLSLINCTILFFWYRPEHNIRAIFSTRLTVTSAGTYIEFQHFKI